MKIAERCADNGFGHYVVLQLPNVSALPKISGPFISQRSAWRAMEWIECAFPAVRFRLTTAVKVSSDPEDYPTVRDPALPSGQRKIR